MPVDHELFCRVDVEVINDVVVETLIYIQILGYATFEIFIMISKLTYHWLFLDNTMNVHEMLSTIYELAVTATVIMNMQEKAS